MFHPRTIFLNTLNIQLFCLFFEQEVKKLSKPTIEEANLKRTFGPEGKINIKRKKIVGLL